MYDHNKLLQVIMIIKYVDYIKLDQKITSSLVVFCNGPLIAQNMNTIPIGQALSRSISEVRENRRTARIEQCFLQVVSSLDDGVVISDFDVMFNPQYRIDVLKILISAAKSKKFSVLWPGKFENGRLIYAEEGYIDYKFFDIDNYDVTCVV